MFKALRIPVGLRLLSLVVRRQPVRRCACDLIEPIGRSQPTVSHHLALLMDAGLLTREKRAKWAWFRLMQPPGSHL